MITIYSWIGGAKILPSMTNKGGKNFEKQNLGHCFIRYHFFSWLCDKGGSGWAKEW